MHSKLKILTFFFLSLILISCGSDERPKPQKQLEQKTLFSKLNHQKTGIHFKNEIVDTREFNYLFYQYMYNGSGVGAGDFNNDGLVDLYFASNQKSNKLYLNKGDFVFEDITKSAKVACYDNWSNGVSVIDINADGWLDIYVCNSASPKNNENRANKLFINNGDLTFTESAEEWGIADVAYSNQAYLLDYDRDGDLDMYLVNHRIDFKDNLKTDAHIESQISDLHSDKMYRNDGTQFVDVSKECGVLNNAWGLSASIGDFNNDGWQDIYVCNDFVQPDYLYINQKDGTFMDEIQDRISHTSFYSMGSDFEDINNDGFPDLFVADMVSQNHERSIRNMAAMDADEFNRLDEIGYGKQYMFNMLQLNKGNGEFAEIAQVAGVSKTDWSWAPLIVDFDNDGQKDIFITNGIKKDVTDIDYKEEVRMRAVKGNPMGFEEVFNAWPSTRLKNYAYKNTGDLKFENASKKWGLNQALNSNGAIHADLDNDGDYDLVVNNIDAYAGIYRNNSKGDFIRIKLNGPKSNPNAIGAKITLNAFKKGKVQSIKNANRGFFSSTVGDVIFGVNNEIEHYDIVDVVWPDGNAQVYKGVNINSTLEINYFNPDNKANNPKKFRKAITEVPAKEFGLVFKHTEDAYDDFENEVLLPQKQSVYDACSCVADFNGDGLDDVFSGNDSGKAPSLFLQNSGARFIKTQTSFWNDQAIYEDQTCLAFDYDRDGVRGLRASGTSRFSERTKRPFLSSAPSTLTWSASWKRRSNPRSAMPRCKYSASSLSAVSALRPVIVNTFSWVSSSSSSSPNPATASSMR